MLRLKGPSGFLVGDRCAAASVSRTRPEPDRAGDGDGLVLDPTNKFTRVADSASAELRTEAAQQTATIDVTYVGFEAYPAAQAAFQHAVDIWSGLLVAPVPITVRAEFAPLGPGMLGSARAGEHEARLPERSGSKLLVSNRAGKPVQRPGSGSSGIRHHCDLLE